jgi:hypothetical protein
MRFRRVIGPCSQHRWHQVIVLSLKLAGWADLFDDELRAVSDARNRAVHGIRIGDRELRGAVWLARNLLALVESADAA